MWFFRDKRIVLGTLLLWTEGVSWHDLLAGARQFRNIGGAPVELPLQDRTETVP